MAHSEDFSQIDALAAAQRVNRSGSDDSLQASTTNAMRALMDLANQNRSSAISNGYKAFGQYRNSGDLDNLRIKNAVTALKMDSIGSYLKSKGRDSVFLAPLSEYDTTYRRLGADFLRKGEAGKVAEEFEKATGMKRETFLKHMTAASESTIKSSDPQLVDKVLSKFESFVKDIPNEDFRKKVQKEIDSVPGTMRTGVISKAVQQFTVMFAGASVSPRSDLALTPKSSPEAPGKETTALPAATEASSDAGGMAAEAKPGVPADRLLASLGGTKPALVGRSEYRGIEYEKFGNDAVGNVLQTALAEQGEDTIFKQVSRKYKSLATSLKPQPL